MTLNGSSSTEALITADNTAESDCAVTMDAVVNSGQFEASIVLRYQDPGNFYFMGIGSWGHQYSIGRVLNGNAQELLGSGSSSSLAHGQSYNIKAVVQGGTLTLFVNGAPVLTPVTDTSFSSGGLGIRTYNSSISVSTYVIESVGGSFTFGRMDVGSLNTTFYTGVPRATQYTPTKSGKLTDIMLYVTNAGGGGNVIVGVYADNGGKPGALLGTSASRISSDGWHDFSGFNIAVTANTPYWLANESDNSSFLWWYDIGGANYSQGSSAYGALPNPFGAEGATGNYNTSIYAVCSGGGPAPTLTVNSAPVQGMPITIDGAAYTTPVTVS